VKLKNSRAEISLRQIRYKHHLAFRIDQHLYVLSLNHKAGTTAQQILNLLPTVRGAVIRTLHKLRQLYPRKQNRFIQITILTKRLASGARGNIFLLYESPHTIAEEVCNLLYTFLQSEKDLPLGKGEEGLRINFETYSTANKNLKRKLDRLNFGCSHYQHDNSTSKFEYSANCRSCPFLQDRCFLLCLSLGLFHWQSFSNKRKKAFLEKMFFEREMSEETLKFLSELTSDLIRKLSKSPLISLSTLGQVNLCEMEAMAKMLKVQIYLYSEQLEMKLAYRFPETNEPGFLPLHFIWRTKVVGNKTYNHVSYIFNTKEFYLKYGASCTACKRKVTFKSYSRHRCLPAKKCLACGRYCGNARLRHAPMEIIPFTCNYPVTNPDSGLLVCSICNIAVANVKRCLALHKRKCKLKQIKANKSKAAPNLFFCKLCFLRHEPDLPCAFKKSSINKHLFSLACVTFLLKDYGNPVLEIQFTYEFNKRGQFLTKRFSHPASKKCYDDSNTSLISHDYFQGKKFPVSLWNHLPGSGRGGKYPRRQTFFNGQVAKFLKYKSSKLEVHFLQFIFGIPLKNYVVIVSFQPVLSTILHTLIQHGFNPYCLSKNASIMKIELKSLNLSFQFAENYPLPVEEPEIYFPQRLLEISSFGKVFKGLRQEDFLPPWKTVSSKGEIIIKNMCQKVFNFDKELFSYAIYQNAQLLRSLLSFLRTCYELQDYYFENIVINETSYIDVLACSTYSCYSYELLKRFSLDSFQLFSLPYQDGITGQHSREESEWISLRMAIGDDTRVLSYFTSSNLPKFFHCIPDYILESSHNALSCKSKYTLGFYHGLKWHPVSSLDKLKTSAAHISVNVNQKGRFSLSNFSLTETWKTIDGKFNKQAQQIMQANPNVEAIEVIYDLQFYALKKDPNVANFLKNKFNQVGPEILNPRRCLKYSRREVFNSFFDSKEAESGTQIIQVDQNAAFLSAGLKAKCPVGKSIHLLKCDFSPCDFTFENEELCYQKVPACGFVKVLVLAKKQEVFPFLTTQIDQNEIPLLCHTCALKKSKGICRHSWQEKSAIIEIPINTLNYAIITKSYQLLHIFEAILFPESDFIFKSYFLPLSRLLMTSKGWDQNITELEKVKYCNSVNLRMGFQGNLLLKPASFKENSHLRHMLKQSFCLAIGKLSQKQQPCQKFVRDHYEIENTLKSNKLLNFKLLTNNFCALELHPKKLRKFEINNQIPGHSYLLSEFNISIHRTISQLISSGINLMSLSHDSIFFTVQASTRIPVNLSFCVGEYRIVTSDIKSFCAFSPSKYMYTDNNGTHFKLCGISVSRLNNGELTKERFLSMFKDALENEPSTIRLTQFRKVPMRLEVEKIECAVDISNRFFNKGRMREDLKFYPYGFTV